VTFTKDGVSWEAVCYNAASYAFTPDTNYGGQICAWDTSPFVAFQAHAGKLDEYDSIFGAILASVKVDPVWANAVAMLGDQLVKQRIASQHEAAMAAIRASQATYARSNSNRSSIERQSESNSNVSEGWTNTLTDTDTWSDGGSKYEAPSGYDYAWSGGDGKTYYTNDSTFNPNHSSDFSGDWTQMEKTPW
jgi:type II secretory pathway pseudopilin PulG